VRCHTRDVLNLRKCGWNGTPPDRELRVTRLPVYRTFGLTYDDYTTSTIHTFIRYSTTNMPVAVSSHRRGNSADPDDLDNLLDYDGAVDDFWKDMPEPNGDNANEPNNAPEKDMDEEVKVAKKRKPNPKLDEDRYVQKSHNTSPLS
jgi:hypothetical protein